MTTKTFLDFEASSLSWDSYPIEIAWGSSTKNIKSYLISPKSIKEWTDWNDEAQKLHGIERTMLLEKGIEPAIICNEFEQSVKGAEIYTDNPCWDAMWLYKLFFFSGRDIPPVDIKHFDELLSSIVCPNIENRVKGLYICLKLKSKVSNEMKIKHKASADVEYLIKTYNLAKKYVL